MDNKGVIDVIRANVADCREKGIATVSIEDIERLANELEADPDLVTDDKLRESRIDLDKQMRVESYKARLSSSSRRFEFRVRRAELMTGMTVKTGENAVKSLLVVNGGAALALLAFLGAISRFTANLTIKTDVANALTIFTFGAFIAALTSTFTFLSQAGFGKEFGNGSEKMGRGFRWAAMISAGLSTIAFVCGAWMAAEAFGANIF
jgi:hypothetical protein